MVKWRAERKRRNGPKVCERCGAPHFRNSDYCSQLCRSNAAYRAVVTRYPMCAQLLAEGLRRTDIDTMVRRIEAMEARHHTQYNRPPTPTEIARLARPLPCCAAECCQ